MFKKTALVAGIGLAISATAQADYRWEAGGAITGGDVSSLGVDGTFYLDRVDDTKGPLGEAAFIDRASSISLGYTDGETDSDDTPDLDISRFAADSRLVFGDGGWIVDLGYEYGEPELADGPNPLDTEVTVASIGFGKYLFENTTLSVSYIYTDVEVDVDGGSTFEGDVDSYRADVDHLFQWGDGAGLKVHAAYGFVDVENNDDIDIYEIDGTWYICRDLGIGAAYRLTDDDGLELEEYGVSAEYFITEQVAVTVSYFEGEIDDADLETDSFLVGVRARF